ncbi:pyridoxamine 5'-phosphate oxidase family protein [Sulfurospirillum cavolei]|uniref:pyridoxamine 5'-phosphate oxidase family protein n=1 Tax=Sulfurospirillum cavolei TaxID=366522 RepID=UPI0005AAB5A0|nr:pyridoxamine 5'-phosphate oxidase family protein [Sulfurospirillum cavolei]
MRHRTKTHQLTQEQIEALFERALVGRLGCIRADGYPYVVPMHFIYTSHALYMHGLPKGQKIQSIKANANVCFEIDEMLSLLDHDVQNPCDVNTEFNSIIVQGEAHIVENPDEKKEALAKIVAKFTPHLADKELPEKMINGTAVIRIDIKECVGRYYR